MTEAFLAAFKRFISRRGLCENVYTDCGTNFVGADSRLRNFMRQLTKNSNFINKMASDGIQWHLNPPSAPHFGGIWEAAVKSTKYHLRRVIGESKLTYEELATFLIQIETCLNSRPLTALSNDPQDLEALTPGHFLVGAPLNALPEPSHLLTAENKLTRWQLVQKMRDYFWSRWSSEYLPLLNIRKKWAKSAENLSVGMLCIIRGENTAPTHWPLARIIATHPSKDGNVKIVTVRTATTTLVRPVVKIIPFNLIAE
ncbi:uncharacterized protein [Cardiocondyla obscurior]|uniref:uncharacterized protein n=1 Tax=Cardiocondyla obscurior TaxID=286306 RepID=UPI0039656C85